MTIMTIRIPDDVKEALDKAFEGEHQGHDHRANHP
jgi:predicted transcriptional regulator